ncbi:unnamed protein product [Cuscuta campestris]|uniref:Uncharacterized protein n=1 Tax=Cuscuta campestris TaxID=132261 RepID=A0A484LZL7_9ASTE|nr:unnamed protein product [Cuscuta campestris]
MKVVGANVHFQKLEAKCSSSTFFQSYMEMMGAQELSEFLQMEIRLKFEEEVLEFYRNGEVKTAHSKKDPQRTFPVIKSTVGGTKVKLWQKKLGEKLRLPNSGVEVGKLPVKNLDWNIIGISGQIPSSPAKKADLNNDYKLILELVIACLECGSGGHADDITQERAFIINALITKTKVNWAAHFFNSISKHLGKPNQKYLCQGLYLGHILESMGIASEGKKYGERYWLYYLSSKGENRAGTSATAEESSSDNVLLIHMAKTAKRKQVVSPFISIEAPQNLALACLEEEEEVSDHGELQRKKKRKINSPSTSGNVNPDELKEKETAEETSMAEVEVSQTPIAIFEEPNEAEDSDSLSRYISNFALDEAEGESERTLKVTDEEDVQEDAESLPLQLFQRTSSCWNTGLRLRRTKLCSFMTDIAVEPRLDFQRLLEQRCRLPYSAVQPKPKIQCIGTKFLDSDVDPATALSGQTSIFKSQT